MKALAIIAALATPALAEDTFEQKATGAEKVAQLDDLVWAVTAPCTGDDVTQRQCRQLRDGKLAKLAGKPLAIALGPITVGPWNGAKKSAEVTISGCLRCDGAAGTHVIAGAPAVDGGKPAPRAIVSRALPFESDAARASFAASVANARTELVVTLDPKTAKWSAGGQSGIRVDVVAYRVITPCDGKIVLASPASQPIAANPKSCTK